jgi:CHAT domain-containing protein
MRLTFELAVGPADSGAMLRVRLGSATLTDEHTLPTSQEKLQRLSRQLVGVLRRGNRARALAEDALSELRFLGEELHRALIPPALEPELRRGGGPLLLDLDEALVSIPFELLFDGEQFLCRRYALGRAVRSTVPRRGPERRALGTPPRALIIAANPRGDLAEVHAESDAIVDALEKERVRARLSADMGREAVRRELKDFDLVHFAGHADFLAADPTQSGWHLSDGKLTAADILSLAGGRPMPLVVFSNACESGRTVEWTDDDAHGEARRAYGLAGAFLYAGVRHYVGTQWEVIDGHSANFATAFYQNLGSGQAIGAAVRHARDAVITKGGEGALAWASYVLYGDPADRPLRRGDARQLLMPSAKELAARESAPWKRPTPQTMKRVGSEIAERARESADTIREGDGAAHAPMSPTRRALLYGSLAGLLVTSIAAAFLWLTRPEPSRLAIFPIVTLNGDPAIAARVEACLDGALAAAGAPLVPAAQLKALGGTTTLQASNDERALSLATALGARWVLWGEASGTPAEASLRLLEVKHGLLLQNVHMHTDDLPTSCADTARTLRAALR